MRCAITIALAALALTGCVNLAPERAQPQVTAQLPEGFPNNENAAPYRPTAWWTAFQDPVLDALVADALADNLDRAISAALFCDRRDCARYGASFSWEAATAQFLAGLAPLDQSADQSATA